MQSKWTDKGCIQLRQKIASSELSCTTLLDDVYATIDALDQHIGAFLTLFKEQAYAQAVDIDARIGQGQTVGQLAGLPIAVKDNIVMTVGATSCASKSLETFHSPYNAHVIERLLAEDAVIIGKVNMDEFAMGSSTENSALKKTVNPWDATCVPGGSSGGSAAAVAAGLCSAALGSDTGGSIRQPASFCGVVGLKPTYGRVSRYGLVAYGSSLDQIGPLTRTVQDCALMLNAIAGHDPRDSTSVDASVAPMCDYLAELEQPGTDLKIGVVPELTAGTDAAVQKAVQDAIETYQSQGAEIMEVELPHAEYAIAAYYVIATAEASSNLARYDGVHYGHRTADPQDYVELYSKSRAEGFGPEVKRRIMLGTYALSSGYYDAYYLKALKVRQLIRQDFAKAFDTCDCLMMPVSPTTAFKIGEKTADPLQMYLADIYTISANLAGIPALSLPCGFDDRNLPIGLQILGPAFSEAQLLRIAQMYQGVTQWHERAPAMSKE